MSTATATPATPATTAADLRAGDLLLAGHGYGETPAFVVRATRFTKRITAVTVTDGDRERVLNLPSTQLLDVAPRAGESLDGLVDYDLARDAR